MNAERRGARRKPLDVQVTYRVNGQARAESYQVEAVNVSETGILLRTELPLAIGTEIELEFALPGQTERLRLHGQVVWSNGVTDGGGRTFTGKGIHFTGYGAGCRALIAAYVGG